MKIKCYEAGRTADAVRVAPNTLSTGIWIPLSVITYTHTAAAEPGRESMPRQKTLHLEDWWADKNEGKLDAFEEA